MSAAIRAAALMAIAFQAADFTYFFQWWYNLPLKRLMTGLKPLIEKLKIHLV